MTKGQQKIIEEDVVMYFETSHGYYEDFEEFSKDYKEVFKTKKAMQEGYDYYNELIECGPSGIIDELGEDEFSEDYLEEYNDEE